MIKRILQSIKNARLTPEEYAKRIGVKIGKGCYISTKSFSSEPYLIEIGDYVRVAFGTSFYTHGGIWSLRHYYNDKTLDHFGRIKIGSYTSVGANCMILPGVTIGERCIIGGGSVVTKSVPDGCIVAGNPAKFVGYTEDFYNRIKDCENTKTGGMSAEEKKKVLLSLPEDVFIKKKELRTNPINK